MKKRILLVDDDRELGTMLQEYLELEDFDCILAQDGPQGLALAQAERPDLVVLDVMLPGLNGFEVLRRLRETSQVPVLMLTARGEDVDRIVGLEMGADDYLPKPCNPRELVARLRAILRRAQGREPPPARLRVGKLELDPAARRALFNDEPLDLTSTEFSILQILMEDAGHPVAKETLSRQALGRELGPYDRSIDMHLSNLRHKLAQRTPERLIVTIRGVGYQLTRS